MTGILLSLAAPIAGLCTFFGISLLIWGASSRRQSDPYEKRLAELARGGATLDDIEMQASFSERFLRPLMAGIARGLSRFTPASSLDNIQQRLLNAGFQGRMQVSDFIGLKGFGLFLGLAFAAFVVFVGHSSIFVAFVLVVLFGGIGYYGPDLWLRSQTDRRKLLIANALPDIIDLLTISVEAGLGFDQAMARIVSKSAATNTLAQEFARVLQQMNFGITRRDALRDMAARAGVDDLNQFVGAIVQAEQLGASVGRVLRIQSGEMRVRRRQRAQRLAQQAPIKMLFPMAFLILPSIFVVVLGPAVPRIVKVFVPNAPL